MKGLQVWASKPEIIRSSHGELRHTGPAVAVALRVHWCPSELRRIPASRFGVCRVLGWLLHACLCNAFDVCRAHEMDGKPGMG